MHPHFVSFRLGLRFGARRETYAWYAIPGRGHVLQHMAPPRTHGQGIRLYGRIPSARREHIGTTRILDFERNARTLRCRLHFVDQPRYLGYKSNGANGGGR